MRSFGNLILVEVLLCGHSLSMSMRRPKRIAIVGGGPGGLTLANGLLGTGKSSLPPFFEEVAVFDRFNELKPGTGGGIQINGGAAVLAELGFRDELKESGLPMRRVVSRRARMGTKLLDLDVAEAFQNSASSWLLQPGGEKGDANGQDVMSFTIMRDELSRMLAAKLPPGTLRFGKELVGIEKAAEGQSREGLVCVFADGSKSEAFDLVVGCDGINSKVREWVLESSSGEAEGNNEENEPSTQGLKTSSGLKIQFGVGPSGSRPPSSVGEMRQWFSSDGAYALTATYGGVGGELFDMVALTTYCDEGEDEEEKRDQQGASSSSSSSSPPKKRSRRTNPNWDTAQVKR